MPLTEYSKKSKGNPSVFFNDLPYDVRKKIIEDMEAGLEKTKLILKKNENRRSNIAKS